MNPHALSFASRVPAVPAQPGAPTGVVGGGVVGYSNVRHMPASPTVGFGLSDLSAITGIASAVLPALGVKDKNVLNIANLASQGLNLASQADAGTLYQTDIVRKAGQIAQQAGEAFDIDLLKKGGQLAQLGATSTEIVNRMNSERAAAANYLRQQGVSEDRIPALVQQMEPQIQQRVAAYAQWRASSTGMIDQPAPGNQLSTTVPRYYEPGKLPWEPQGQALPSLPSQPAAPVWTPPVQQAPAWTPPAATPPAPAYPAWTPPPSAPPTAMPPGGQQPAWTPPAAAPAQPRPTVPPAQRPSVMPPSMPSRANSNAAAVAQRAGAAIRELQRTAPCDPSTASYCRTRPTPFGTVQSVGEQHCCRVRTTGRGILVTEDAGSADSWPASFWEMPAGDYYYVDCTEAQADTPDRYRLEVPGTAVPEPPCIRTSGTRLRTIVVPDDWLVEIYSEPGFRGNRREMGPGRYDLPARGWTDQIQSMRIRGPWTVYDGMVFDRLSRRRTDWASADAPTSLPDDDIVRMVLEDPERKEPPEFFDDPIEAWPSSYGPGWGKKRDELRSRRIMSIPERKVLLNMNTLQHGG